MTVSSEIKEKFLLNFQNRIVQGRKLLHNANHNWASRLFTDLLFTIETTEWLVPQKKRQLIMIITNSWWIYLNSLTKAKEKTDVIRYIDAYKRFYSFLSQLDEFDLFNNFWMNLLKDFIKLEDLSIEGFTKFVNSFSIKVKERDDHLKLIELQILLMYLRKSVFPSDLFSISLKLLGEILYKLEPAKKALLLYVFLENVNIKYNLTKDEDEQDFIQNIYKILADRLPNYLEEDFDNMSKITINDSNFSSTLGELEELTYYLNNIGENSWIIVILRFLFSKINEYQSFEDALFYIKDFIDFAIKRNRFSLAYEIYDFLEDIFMYRTDLGYDDALIELWVEACKRFFDLEERKYLLLSMEKLSNNLKIPQSPIQIYHYFYTCNYLWQFKSKNFTLEFTDFWNMMFYRALYEERDFDLAGKIVPYMDADIRVKLSDLNMLYDKAAPMKAQIYAEKDNFDATITINRDFIINRALIRIKREGKISFRLISTDSTSVEGEIVNEYWNDTLLMNIYYDLFSGVQEKKFKFNLTEFGKLVFLYLPKGARNIFKQLKIKSRNLKPQIYFILDEMTIPFGLIHDDDNFLMLKYASGYKIGEPSLTGATFEQISQEMPAANILIIETTNSKGPLKWNEEFKNKTLIFPFPDGYDEINYITNFMNITEGVGQTKILNGFNSTREKIIAELSSGDYNIIYFIGNIFYSKMSPHDSYFISNDNKSTTINEINNILNISESKVKPLLFFNAQYFEGDGKQLKNALKQLGEIFSQFNYNRITGIISRTYPIFNEDARKIIGNFYINLLNNENQGIALLKARQQCKSGLAISSFVHFGKPWDKLLS
jgi:hypothetical protein